MIIRDLLSIDEQRHAIDLARAICEQTGLVRPTMRDGTPLRLRHASAGVGWWHSDRDGYRYERAHPLTGAPIPPMPEAEVREWWARAHERAGVPVEHEPNHLGVLVYVAGEGRLGEHVDRQERNGAPIITISLGAPATYTERHGYRIDREHVWSGDAIMLHGVHRKTPHAIERVLVEPMLRAIGLPWDVRVSLTMRRVDL